MREDQHRFLALLGQLPGRLTAEQAAWVINCQPHDIPVLITNHFLKPLGNPPQNGIKYFAAVDVLELSRDRTQLMRASAAIYRHWQKQNARKRNRVTSVPLEENRAAVDESIAAEA